MQRLSQQQILAKGYKHTKHTVAKYYLDLPTTTIVDKKEDANGHVYYPYILQHAKKYMNREVVGYFFGLLGYGYQILDKNDELPYNGLIYANLTIPFRHTSYLLTVYNDIYGQTGFTLKQNKPISKNAYYFAVGSVARPKSYFDIPVDVVKFLLSNPRPEYGRFHNLARNMALDLLEKEISV